MFNNYKRTIPCRFIALGVASLLIVKLSAQEIVTDTLSLTLQQAEQQFVQKNLTLLAGHYNVEVSKALIQQAKLWDNPVLNTDQNIYADGKVMSHGKTDNGQPNGEIYIQVQQLLRTAGKRAKQVDLVTTSSQISELQLQDVMRSLKYQLRSSYYNLAQMLAVQNIYFQEQTEMQKLLTGMAAELKAGNIAQKDYLRIQALVISLEQDITENNRTLSDVETKLKTLLQVTGTTFIKPVDTLAYTAYITPGIDELVTTAKTNNPAYLIEQKQITYQQQNLVYQKALRSPDLTVAPEYDRASNYIPNYFGLTVSLPLPILNKNQGNIRAAEFSIKQEQTNLQVIETQLSNDVVNAYSKLMFTQKQNNNMQNDFYSKYQTLFSNVMQSYRQRQLSLLEFIDYFDAYKESSIRLLQQKLNLQLAKEELNFQTGTDVIK